MRYYMTSTCLAHSEHVANVTCYYWLLSHRRLVELPCFWLGHHAILL